MRGLRGVRVSAEVVNSVAVGDWMGDPDVTLGWGLGPCGMVRRTR